MNTFIKQNLKTPRFNLILRTVDELNAIVQMSDEDMADKFQFSNLEEITNERSRALRLLERDESEYVLWDVHERSTGDNIANLGFHNLKMNHKRSEIGYWCTLNWRRRGVISEALSAVLNFGFNEMSLNRIEAFLDINNIASEKVLLKSNFIKEGTLREHYIDHDRPCDSFVYSIIKSEYIISNK